MVMRRTFPEKKKKAPRVVTPMDPEWEKRLE